LTPERLEKFMLRIAVVAGLTMVLAGPALAQERLEPGEVRHSGRIIEVAPDGSRVLLEELVAWTGPGTGIVRRSIQLTPRTSIRLVERTDRWAGDRTSLPGWDVEMIAARSLRPGDFVTVTTDDDQRAVAVALQVVRPAPR
jgi:hypothetical protein